MKKIDKILSFISDAESLASGSDSRLSISKLIALLECRFSVVIDYKPSLGCDQPKILEVYNSRKSVRVGTRIDLIRLDSNIWRFH